MAKALKINDKWVNFVGRHTDPRYVWITDRLGKQIVENPTSFGVNGEDLVVCFPSGKYGDVEEFFRLKKSEIGSAQAVIFLLVGADEIAEDAPPVLSHAIRKYWLHPRGPRQVPLHSAVEVTAKYEALVDVALQTFPSARVVTSDPAPRRSGHGFAIKRAMRVSDEIQKKDERHSHIRLIRKFHAKRPAGKGNLLKEGGKYPLREVHFEEDGMTMTFNALAGVYIRAKVYVESIVGREGMAIPNEIDGLKIKF